MPRLKPEEHVYVRSMSKVYRVTAIFGSDAATNKYLEKHGPDEGVIASFDDGKPTQRTYVAALHDNGYVIGDRK